MNFQTAASKPKFFLTEWQQGFTNYCYVVMLPCVVVKGCENRDFSLFLAFTPRPTSDCVFRYRICIFSQQIKIISATRTCVSRPILVPTDWTYEFLNVTNEMQLLENFIIRAILIIKFSSSCISLVTLRNSYVMMHGPMNIKLIERNSKWYIINI